MPCYGAYSSSSTLTEKVNIEDSSPSPALENREELREVQMKSTIASISDKHTMASKHGIGPDMFVA